MISKKFRAVIAALLFAPAAAFAALSQYEITFSPHAADADGGVGWFYWDDSTHVISGFTWDFGNGNTGGLNYPDWTRPVFGGTQGEFLFEILTLQDMHPAPCTVIEGECGSSYGNDNVYGYYDTVEFSMFGAINPQQYSFDGIWEGTFSTHLVANGISEPGTRALIALGLLGITRMRRD